LRESGCGGRPKAQAFGYQPCPFKTVGSSSAAQRSRCYEQTAGPSTTPLAMKLQEAPLRMTSSTSVNHLSSSYMSIHAVSCLRSSGHKQWPPVKATSQLLVASEKEQTTTRTNIGVLRFAQNDNVNTNPSNNVSNCVNNFRDRTLAAEDLFQLLQA
jgi:hypothetical protein